MANPPPEVRSEWNGKRGGDERSAVNTATAQVLIDHLDKLLQKHCQQLALRMEAQHALLQRVAESAATTVNQSSIPKLQDEAPLNSIPKLQDEAPLKVVPATIAKQSSVPTLQQEDEEAVEELHASAPCPAWEEEPRAPALASAPTKHTLESSGASVSSPRASVVTDGTAGELCTLRSAVKRRSTSSADAALPVRSQRSQASFQTSEQLRQRKMRAIVKGPSRSDSMQSYRKGHIRERLTRIVNSCCFEGCSCFFILVSMLFFGVETEYMAQNRIEHIPEGFVIFSRVFATLFTLELALHLIVEGWGFFTSEFWFSNVIDVIIVVVTLLQVVLDLALDQDGNRTNLTHIRVIRLVRTIRVLRVVRIMKFFRSLRILVYSVLNTLKSLCWVMFMLLVIIYIFALLFTQAANEQIVHLGPGGEADRLARYFGSLGLSIYTLFKVITGGLNWELAASPLESIGPAWMLIFVSFVAFNYLALLNVVMGLVCQTAIESAYHDLDVVVQTQLSYQEEYTKKFKALFKSIDLQDTGILTLKDLEERLQDPWLQDYFAAMDLTTIEAWTLFKLLDANDSCEIDVDEFVSGCLRLRGNARSIDMHMLMYESKWMLKQMANFARRQKKQEFMLGEHLDHENSRGV